MQEKFVFESTEFNQCHAPTVISTQTGLLMACFAGPREGHDKTGIWGSLLHNDVWVNQKQIVDSSQPDGKSTPLWNPVLFRFNEEVRLYYRFGKTPESWGCAFVSSNDCCENWSEPTILASSITGPVKNRPLHLDNGNVIIPTSSESDSWTIHFELTEDGKSNSKKVNCPQCSIQAIQPVILEHKNQILQALCRTKQKFIGETWSLDNGETWSELSLTKLKNPDSAIDAIKVDDLGYLLVYNNSSRDRCNLELAVSKDGRSWENKVTLENTLGEFSYPCLEIAENGSLHVLYTYNRKNIKHVEYLKNEVFEMFQHL